MWELDLSHFLKPLRYQQVASIGDDAFDDITSNSSPPGLPSVNGQKAVKRKSTMYTLSHLFLSCLCLILSISFLFFKYYHELSDEKCLRRLSAPSLSLHLKSCSSQLTTTTIGPALEAVELELVTFNDTFQPDEYSGYPSATSEKAWGALWDCEFKPPNIYLVDEAKLIQTVGAFTVPLESLAGLNKSSMTADFRLVGSRTGAGVGGLLEGAHQIHCLVSDARWMLRLTS